MAVKKINPKIANETVLLLADLLSPLRYATHTIEWLAKNKNKVIVVSFSGGEGLFLKAENIASLLKRKFIDLPETAGRLPEYDIPHLYFVRTAKLLGQMRPGDIAVIENLNLLSAEEQQHLSEISTVFMNDDFSADQSKVEKLSGAFVDNPGPDRSRLEKRVTKFLIGSKKPIVLLLGGWRLSGKEQLLDKLMRKADHILVGGAIANLFFKNQGFEIGKSAFDAEADPNIVKKMFRDHRVKLKMPLDVVVGTSVAEGGAVSKSPDKVRSHEMILDVGPQTTLEYSKFIKAAKTLIWFGAFGRVESGSFRHGTLALLRLAASRPAQTGTILAASGESVLDILEREGFFEELDLAVPDTHALLRALAN